MIDVVALALAPLSLVAPFSGVTIVIASWLASSGLVFVKETLDWWDTTSTCIALVGVTVTSIFGSHASPVYSAADLYAYFSKPAFQAYLALSLSALAVLWLLYAANVAQLRTKAAWFSIVLFSYTSAAFGSASLLLLKVVGSGIRVALQTGTAAFGSRLYVVSLAVLVLCALAQLAFLHFTLANSPVSYGVPTYQTLLTVLTIVSGGVFFSEFDRMPPAHFVCFVAGVAISLLGVALTRRTATASSARRPPSAPPPTTATPRCRSRRSRFRRRPGRRTRRTASRPPRSPPPRRRSRASTSGAGCSPPPLAEARRAGTRPSSPRHASCVCFSVELSFYRSWTAQRWTTQRDGHIAIRTARRS